MGDVTHFYKPRLRDPSSFYSHGVSIFEAGKRVVPAKALTIALSAFSRGELYTALLDRFENFEARTTYPTGNMCARSPKTRVTRSNRVFYVRPNIAIEGQWFPSHPLAANSWSETRFASGIRRPEVSRGYEVL